MFYRRFTEFDLNGPVGTVLVGLSATVHIGALSFSIAGRPTALALISPSNLVILVWIAVFA